MPFTPADDVDDRRPARAAGRHRRTPSRALPRRALAVVAVSAVALVPTAAVACGDGGSPGWNHGPSAASAWSWWHGTADRFSWWDDGDHGWWHGGGGGTEAAPRPDVTASAAPTNDPVAEPTAPSVPEPAPVPTMTVAPEPSLTPTATPSELPSATSTPEPTEAPQPTPSESVPPATDPPATEPPVTPTPTPTGSSTAGSGVAMPRGDLPGWRQVFADDFPGSDLSSAWGRYSGQPGGDPAGYWLPTHAVVNSGALKLLGYADSGHDASGGVAAWGPTNQTYGKYEVRFRADAANGYAYAFLLWPVAENWPVGGEIDFAEDGGGDRQGTTATLHYGADNAQIARSLQADFTQWHTVGVEWTAGRLVYTLDGKAWATVTSSGVPSQPMFLALQQQAYPCTQWSTCVDATTPDVTGIEIDWVSVYAPE